MTDSSARMNVAIRQDIRYPHLTELSMNYEGKTEDISIRPPDLSPHGMFVNTYKELPEGAVLQLRFRLARTGIPVNVRCEVRYCLKGVGVGVQFLDISPEAVQAIEKEISAQTAKE